MEHFIYERENLVKYLIEGIATLGTILKPEKNRVENFLDHGLHFKGLVIKCLFIMLIILLTPVLTSSFSQSGVKMSVFIIFFKLSLLLLNENLKFTKTSE
jgi:hypothetical protein